MKRVETQEKGRYRIAFAVVLLIVLLTCCVFTGSILAWLKDKDTNSSSGELEIGSVDFEIYSGNTKLTTIRNSADEKVVLTTSSPLVVTGNSAIRNIDLKIRNTGTVTAIMRVTLSIYFENDNGVRSVCLLSDTPTLFNQIDITNDGWINDFAPGVAMGYSYYNGQIKPYTIRTVGTDGTVTSTDKTENAVSVLTQILASSTATSTKYYVDVSVEGVAYSGNIYKEEADRDADLEYEIPAEGAGVYPFGKLENIPSLWTAWQ